LAITGDLDRERNHLKKETVLVVGLGEVGYALFKLLRESGKFTVYGFDIDRKRMRAVQQTEIQKRVDTMHVCIPFLDQGEFVSAVTGYTLRFKPKLVIIDSTVMPGTTNEVRKHCSCLVAHSPVRGMHKSSEHMKWELKRWTKYVGGAGAKAGEAACKHFEKLGLRTKLLKSCTETELAKLFETTYRAWMITCFQEMHRVSRFFKADFEEVTDFLADTHRVRFDRPLMFPGVIGGHCLIPNVELLLRSHDSELLELILKSNEKRKQEMKDQSVREEAEKIKYRAEALEQELTKT
jgi:UDP-N-acetyl-D-mannosaminuronate dehydrogenase